MAPPLAPTRQEGGGGLARSLHSGAPFPPSRSLPFTDFEAIGKKVDGLVSMANPDMKGAARGMGQDLLALVQKIYNASQAQTGNISLANLRKVVAEEVKAAVNGTPGEKILGCSGLPGTYPLSDAAHHGNKDSTNPNKQGDPS
ncbi:hypothetical protein B0H66DRAFT_252976 [Apodospora peruviana]|uniref:Uncharacterized protein n=1 Tax=Apodospora peruviana TaxID=516989 RepID=A0AAE0I5V4_9PEZI|nr:hypothetical protein B0H66DRAFT_252976 [Apodospora peruviana]